MAEYLTNPTYRGKTYKELGAHVFGVALTTNAGNVSWSILCMAHKDTSIQAGRSSAFGALEVLWVLLLVFGSRGEKTKSTEQRRPNKQKVYRSGRISQLSAHNKDSDGVRPPRQKTLIQQLQTIVPLAFPSLAKYISQWAIRLFVFSASLHSIWLPTQPSWLGEFYSRSKLQQSPEN